MALVKKPVDAAPVGAFEEVETEGTTTVENEVEQSAEPSVTDKVKVEASAAIAKAANTSVGKVGKFQTALSDFENALPAIDFGVLPRLKGSQGAILDSDNKTLGDEVSLTVISFNNQYVVTPGEDDDESTKFVKYSSDGITIDATGQLVSEYIAQLVTVDGYPNAEMKHYLEVVGILNKTAKPSELVGEMVQVSMSPQSRKAFEAYRLQRSVKIRMGRATAEGSEEIIIRAVTKTMGKFTFTVLVASDK